VIAESLAMDEAELVKKAAESTMELLTGSAADRWVEIQLREAPNAPSR
jgi:hypothetical protein